MYTIFVYLVMSRAKHSYIEQEKKPKKETFVSVEWFHSFALSAFSLSLPLILISQPSSLYNHV
jgi:hypothetical protein